MANEIGLPGITSGLTTAYAMVYNAVNQVWSTVAVAFVAYATADRANYDVALTEQGTASGRYVGSFPAAIPAGVYSVSAYNRISGAPAETDTFLGGGGGYQWSGTVEVAMTDLATLLLDLSDGVETGYTLRQTLRLLGASIGTVTGAPVSPLFRNLANNKTRLTAVCDEDGNRTVTFDAT